MNVSLDMQTHDGGPWRHGPATSRRALTLVVALAVAVGLAGMAPASAADDSREVSASTHVQAGGHAELCVESSEADECAELGQDLSGQLAATAVVSTSTDDSRVSVSVEGCPDNQAGAVIVFSNTGPGAQVNASFDGEATVDGESQDVDEDVGPIDVGPSGEASASVCASASAEVGGGDSDASQDGALHTVREFLASVLP